MNRLTFSAAVLGIVAIAAWAYSVNYKTAHALRTVERLRGQIAETREDVTVMEVEWAYLNRPERLRDLVETHHEDLALGDLAPEHFGDLPAVPFPPREEQDPLAAALAAAASSILAQHAGIEAPVEAPAPGLLPIVHPDAATVGRESQTAVGPGAAVRPQGQPVAADPALTVAADPTAAPQEAASALSDDARSPIERMAVPLPRPTDLGRTSAAETPEEGVSAPEAAEAQSDPQTAQTAETAEIAGTRLAPRAAPLPPAGPAARRARAAAQPTSTGPAQVAAAAPAAETTAPRPLYAPEAAVTTAAPAPAATPAIAALADGQRLPPAVIAASQ
ncbi:MAG: hypothetical protein AAFS07_12485 [Pseudomonadota bacterium]